MKNNILLIFAVIAGMLLTSCYDDKGSYDYQDINEAEIYGLGEGLNVIYKKDTIRISPQIKYTLDSVHLERYEYEWKAVPGLANNNPGGVISRSRDLEYFTELFPGAYSLYLKVKDKETGLVWKNYVPLVVRTQVARGFLILGEEEDGTVGLDMVSMSNDTIVLKDLLKNNGLPVLRKPLRVMYTGSYTPSMDPYVRLWIMTEEGSYYVNTSTFTGTALNNFQSMVYTSFEIPSVLNPVHMIVKSNIGSMATTRMVACDDGNVYMASLYSGEYYSNPVNRGSKTQNVLYKTFPYIFSAPGRVGGYVLYDMEQDRFLRMSTFDSYTREMTDNAGDIFPWNQENNGRKLIYGENTMNTDGGSSTGNSFALMKDNNNNFFIYKFYAYSNAYKRGGFTIKMASATNLNNAELFAFSSKRTLFLYAVGKTLYAYDYNEGYETLYTKEFEDEITMIKFDIESNSTYNDLYVATYNAESGGILQKYTLEPDQNNFELNPDEKCCWKGLVKVKSIDWRNSDK